MKQKTLTLLFSLIILTTLTTGYTDFSDFDRENAGITPESSLYGLDRTIEKLSLSLSFSADQKTEKHLQQLQERGDEMEALTWLNHTRKAREIEYEIEQKIEKIMNISEKAGENKREKVK